MSRVDFENIMIVNDVHKSLNKMEEYLGEKCRVVLSKKAQEKWAELEKKHKAFYDMPMQERLYYSGMATRRYKQ